MFYAFFMKLIVIKLKNYNVLFMYTKILNFFQILFFFLITFFLFKFYCLLSDKKDAENVWS